MPVPDGSSWPRPAACPRCSPPPTTPSSPRPACSPASGCSSTARAGGVGTAAIQLGRAAGARVTATVRNPDLRDEVAALGATVIAPEDFGEHGPFDVILELVGAINLSENLKSLDTGGRITVIGTGAGAKGEINLGLLMMKRARIHGSTLRARPLEHKALTARARRALRAAAARRRHGHGAGRRDLPARRGAAAYEHFQAGGKLGKIILELLGRPITRAAPGGAAAGSLPASRRGWITSPRRVTSSSPRR